MTDEKTTNLGRPLKTKTRRFQQTIYAPGHILDAIDKIVAERKAAGEKDFSLSEFYNEGATEKLRALGRLPKGTN